MKALAWTLLVGLAAGCGEDADVAGTYSVSVTNRDNACMFTNWTAGETAANIPVVITQRGSDVTLTINGVAGVLLVGLLGADGNVYAGGVDSTNIDVESFGTRSQTSGNCTFTYNSRISGELDGDALSGRIEYRAADNGNPDCAAISGCLTYQDFNGTRPPT